jgi:transcriptional regulator with XRE-family HTH domain
MKTPARKSASKRPRQHAPRMDYDKAAAQVLREARSKDGRAPEDVALAAGQSVAWLRGVEKGERLLTLSEFLALADVLRLGVGKAVRAIIKRPAPRS